MSWFKQNGRMSPTPYPGAGVTTWGKPQTGAMQAAQQGMRMSPTPYPGGGGMGGAMGAASPGGGGMGHAFGAAFGGGGGGQTTGRVNARPYGTLGDLAGGGQVQMQGPDGSLRMVAAGDIQKFTALGAKVVG